MELPDDVLTIVRAYAKPWFPYYKEYQLALRLFGVDTIPNLRTTLTLHPDIIIPILLAYEKAHKEFVIARDEYNLHYPWAIGTIRNNYLMKIHALQDQHHRFQFLFPLSIPRLYPLRF
jgi:hypothetical protein